MSRILDFQDGFTSASEPDQGFVTATKLRNFVDDAAFVTFKGSAATDGDAYYNTTSDLIRYYSDGAWSNLVDEDSTQTLTNKTIDAGSNTITNLPSGVTTEEEGATVVSDTSVINFIGSGVTATDAGSGQTDVTITAGGGVTVEDEGTGLGSFTILDFVGAGVTASDAGGGQATITIAGGGGAPNVTSQTSNYTAADNDLVLCDASGGDFTVTLPTAATVATVRIVKETAGGKLTIDGDGADTIIGETTQILTSRWAAVTLISDGGTNWIVI